MFDGLEMIEPGLVRVQQWRPDSELEAKSPSMMWGRGSAEKLAAFAGETWLSTRDDPMRAQSAWRPSSTCLRMRSSVTGPRDARRIVILPS
jgi:S-adenosyl methyltransferase